MEFGAGFFGFEVGEINLQFFFLFNFFRHIFSIFALNFGFCILSIFFSVWKLLFLLDIFISAQNYRIAPSTVDGRFYFHFLGYHTFEFGFFSGKFINSSSFFIVVSVYLVRVLRLFWFPQREYLHVIFSIGFSSFQCK